MSALQAAKKYGIPSRTVYDKVQKMGIVRGGTQLTNLKLAILNVRVDGRLYCSIPLTILLQYGGKFYHFIRKEYSDRIPYCTILTIKIQLGKIMNLPTTTVLWTQIHISKHES